MTLSSESASVQPGRLAALQREVPSGGALLATDQANVRFAAGVSSMAESVYRDAPCWAVFTRDAMRLVISSMEVPLFAGLDHVEPYGRFLVHEAGVIDARLNRDTSRASVVASILGQYEVHGPVIATQLSLLSTPRRSEPPASGWS